MHHNSRMGHQMRTWNTFYNVTSEGVAAVVEGEGNFALLYDYPVLKYWKGILQQRMQITYFCKPSFLFLYLRTNL